MAEGKRYKHKQIRDIVYTVIAISATSQDVRLREGDSEGRKFWITQADLKKHYKEFK